MESAHFVLRVTHKGDNDNKINDLLLALKDKTLRYICVTHLHKKDNPHSHIVLDLKVPVKQHNIRYYCQTRFEKKSYSLKVSDDSDKRYSYLFHESDDASHVTHKYNIDDSDLEKWIDMNDKVKSTMKDKGKKMNMIDDIVLQYRKKFENDFDANGYIAFNEYVFVRLVHLVLNYSDWVPNAHQMERYVMTAMRQLCSPDRFAQEYVNFHFSRKFAPRY